MCLAIPAKITELNDGNLATVDILGVTREISVDLTPQAEVGSFVLVHAGFAIEVVDEQFAQETIDLIMQFPDLAGDNAPYLEGAEAEAETGAQAHSGAAESAGQAQEHAEAAPKAAAEGAL